MNSRRIDLIDALRAFALFGILQVNIQSFVWGAGDPLGLFLQPPSALDTATYLLIGTFVSGKFIALFAFLFGAGFSLQMRSRRPAHGDVHSMYRRRLVFLLIAGLAHGVLLYYGDILAFYALCGFLLSALYGRARTAAVARGTRRWWFAYVVVTLVVNGLYEGARRAATVDADPSRIPEDVLHRLATYTTGGWWEQLPLRAADYSSVLTSLAIVNVPLVMGLFTLGVLAARQGWLVHPERHSRVWRCARWLGLLAFVPAAAGAWINYRTMLDSPSDPTAIGYVLMSFGVPMAALYVALFVGFRDRAPVRRAIAWLAPAGRMPLTNYLMQSVVMGALLSGWGFGLGTTFSKAQLAAMAIVIVCVQVAVSRWWIARFGQGPVEALWRRVTYR